MSTFDVLPLRFRFTARETIHFPPGTSSNVLRGSFGRIFKSMACAPECSDAGQCAHRATCAYGRLFEPAALNGEGPSGLHDLPRPFVFRASHLDGRTVPQAEPFEFDLNLFDTREPSIDIFTRVFAELAREGLGRERSRATLEGVDSTALHLSLDPINSAARARVHFRTPTELKGADRPDFGVLFARIRDRISTLRALYGEGPLEIDFKQMGERASRVQMTRCEIRHVDAERVSRRTGQRHSLAGFVGLAEYEGDLTEFIPYLEVARWTGVGRQTVWGKGQLACETF